jgi:hypothetical protein
MQDGTDDRAVGWDAIDARLRPVYGEQAPKHYGTLIKYCLGGPDPLDGISAYRRDAPTPHWHFITYGFSELYEKESDAPDVSGYGFELTFRLARSPEAAEPPRWALHFLQNLARYVFKTGNSFSAGDHMDLNGPIALDEKTGIVAIGFAKEPELESITSPNGRAEFVQVVGLTRDEYGAIRRWNTTGFLEVLSQRIPLLVTDLARRSVLEEPDTAAVVEKRTKAEGSSTGFLFNDSLSWRLESGTRALVTIGANPVRNLREILPGRIPHKRSLALGSGKQTLLFEPSGSL